MGKKEKNLESSIDKVWEWMEAEYKGINHIFQTLCVCVCVCVCSIGWGTAICLPQNCVTKI